MVQTNHINLKKWAKKSNLKKSLNGSYEISQNDIHHWKAEAMRIPKMYNLCKLGKFSLNLALSALCTSSLLRSKHSYTHLLLNLTEHWSKPGTVFNKWKVRKSQTSELLTISKPFGWKTPFKFWFNLSNFFISLPILVSNKTPSFNTNSLEGSNVARFLA